MDIQREYLNLAEKHTRETGEDARWTLREWEYILDALESDPMSLVAKLDWVAKRWALEAFVEEENLQWSDPWLRSIDLEYHNIDLENGLYYELLKEGAMDALVDEDEIVRAAEHPPNDTRAYVRGKAMERFGAQIVSAQWGSIRFNANGRRTDLDLAALADADAALQCIQTLDRSETAEQFLQNMGLL